MKKMNKLITSAGLVSTLCMASQAYASDRIEFVNLNIETPKAKITLENKSNSKSLASINIQPASSTIKFKISGEAECSKYHSRINEIIYWGANSVSPMGPEPAGTLHSDDNVAITNSVKGNNVVEYAPIYTYTVPLSEVKNGHPALRVDPVDFLNKKRDHFVNNGGTALDFYKQDHSYTLNIPLTLTAGCKKNSNHSKTNWKKDMKYAPLDIVYKGDPQLYEAQIAQFVPQTPKLNPQLQGENMPNDINNDLPFKLDSATFQVNMPNYTGGCIPGQNPKIRINFQASGSTNGIIDMAVYPVSNTYADYGVYYQTAGIVNNPENGSGKLDFSFPLKEMLNQNKYSYMTTLNKTYNHNMLIKARYKPFQGGEWSEFKNFGTAVFKHRCVPVANFQIGGNNGGGVNYQGNQAPETPKLKIAPITPDANPVLKLQMVPVTPDPDPAPDARLIVPAE